MTRSVDALAQLSREHHDGLLAARLLDRATRASAAVVRHAFVCFWEREGHAHLGIEEDVLLPALARRRSPRHRAIVRVLTDHVDLRRRAADLAARPQPAPSDLTQLAAHLRANIRHEEHTLFPLIETALHADVAAALEHARRDHRTRTGPRPSTHAGYGAGLTNVRDRRQ